MTSQNRIGLIIFGLSGGVFVVIALGVTALVITHSKSSKATEPSALAKSPVKSATTSSGQPAAKPTPSATSESARSPVVPAKPEVKAAPAALPVVRIGPDSTDWDYRDLADYLRKSDPGLRLLDSRKFNGKWLATSKCDDTGGSLDDFLRYGVERSAILAERMEPGWNWAKFKRGLSDKELEISWGWGRFYFQTLGPNALKWLKERLTE
ncbi:MAG TPA: hypothetical protein VHR66_25335 [Gemmataceae bacterium]|jgi:hypothetical protein|nr:hypothetical protein [Gemmataceae bacterium]